MKKIFQTICIVAISAVVFTSCKKDENRVIFDKGTAPVFTASLSDSIPLNYLSRANQAISFNWTNPNYQLNTGISSYDVSYEIEIDTVGANFTNPKKKVIPVSKDLTISIIQGDFNDYLLNQLELKDSMFHNIEIRVKSFLTGNTGILYSNSIAFKVYPYAIPPKVTPPASGRLFITGAATPGNWQCGCGEPALTSQEFTRNSYTEFELSSIRLNGGASYLFIPVYGSWTEKFGFTGNGNENNVNGDDFKFGGNDFKAPADNGNYKITVDFQRGKFTVVKL